MKTNKTRQKINENIVFQRQATTNNSTHMYHLTATTTVEYTSYTTNQIRRISKMTNNPNSHNTPHMRGIKQAIAELKQNDPATALTEKSLRRLVLTGTIPSVRIGKKYLINMDVLNNYLYNGSCRSEETFTYNHIRKIAE